jgi:hypothetical protein
MLIIGAPRQSRQSTHEKQLESSSDFCFLSHGLTINALIHRFCDGVYCKEKAKKTRNSSMHTDPTQGERVTLTIGEVRAHRDRFRLASDAPSSEQRDLPLREKQALVDEVFRGMPITQIDCRRVTERDGTISYLVQKGWPQLRALLDFMDDQFPTWNAEEKREWEQSQGHE